MGVVMGSVVPYVVVVMGSGRECESICGSGDGEWEGVRAMYRSSDGEWEGV